MKFLNLCSFSLGIFISSFYLQAVEVPAHDFNKNKPLSNQQCIDCHQSQYSDWQKSDHSKAMAIADKTTVLADFANKQVEHYGQKASFFIKDDRYQVTISYDDKSDTYPIKYTFGHFPLQQYLVETVQGRLQVLPFAWDSQTKEAGGQRWYHNYSHEEIRPEDRLHWRQPLQNWNGMCADCHSDGLVRNYNSDKNSFSSQFDNINVGCLSCHGDMSNHAQQVSSPNAKRNVSADVVSATHPTGQWLRTFDEKTASWQGAKRDNTFMDGCFACHSLRSPLTDGIEVNKPFLDQFTPSLPTAPNYHADGQIKEEVYVYGSFLQSKMFAQGVNCLDCHDKHTMKIKIPGNGLCLQCHGGEVYNVKTHHQHDEKSAGAQCVNCHMPENRYMGVDDRRDHSFKIPQPHLSNQFGTPNACIKCHDDQSNQWASDKLSSWHGKAKALLPSKEYLMRLNAGQAISLSQHFAIINDENLPVISRASALSLLGFSTQTISVQQLKPYLIHQEPLLRLHAATIGSLLTPNDRAILLSPLLTDKLKAVRVAAARSLVSIDLPADKQAVFQEAFTELQLANNTSSWRGEGLANQAVIAMEMNQLSDAEKTFKKAIKVDPYFDVSYINLADLYRSQQRAMLVGTVLRQGIKKNPLSGSLTYSYGLHLVRQQKLGKALPYFEKSMKLTPQNSQYAYTYILALDGTGENQQALGKLKLLISNYADRSQLKELGLHLSQKLRSRSDYDWFMKL